MCSKLKIRIKNFSLHTHDSKKSSYALLKYITYGTGIPISVNKEEFIEEEDYRDYSENSIKSLGISK